MNQTKLKISKRIRQFSDEVYRFLHARKNKVINILEVPRYNITSSEKDGYTWFRIAKNGTRSVLSVLENNTTPDINDGDVPYYKKDHINKFKFCIIRNPWDRLVSCYSNKITQQLLIPDCWGKDFDFFIHYLTTIDLKKCDRHIRLQTALFPVSDIDYIGKFENFNDEFNFILNEKLGLNQDPIRKNASQHRHYSDYYNEELIKIVADLYRDDIELGNYSFEATARPIKV